MPRRLSPSLILAIAALVAATGGSAIAAGELITRAEQIAPGVIDGDHIRPHSVAKTDIQHPTLRLRVTSNGGRLRDTGDGTAQRVGIGQYLVRFNRAAVDGGAAGPKNPRWLHDCAVIATPRKSLAVGPAASRLHLAVVGDTYTVLLSGEQTAGRFALIDMLIPAGGGPPPHRHDFEECFHVLEGSVEVSLRDDPPVRLRAGETVNIPANAPHAFRNAGDVPARMLCTAVPAGLEAFFAEFGDRVGSRTASPPALTDEEKQARLRGAVERAPDYGMELLPPSG